MIDAVERPAWRISFRQLAAVALGLAALAFVAGRYVYTRYGGYRPLALAHVPQTMRYRARVSVNDPIRMQQLAPLLRALDPRGKRLPALEQKLGVAAGSAVHEVAFGSGPEPSDFVLVLGLQLQAGTGLSPAPALCEVLATDGVRSEPTDGGCRLPDGAVIAGSEDGGVVVASRAELIKGLLGVPDLGDRLGFSGPSARGTAPEVADLGKEAAALGARLSAKYP
ncbi:MAG TPA: hypothetical protein VEQ59_23030 [Polyangiaceae bacterium]|nr:hypothetical protein [Polyangiaceae bacterium]